MGGCGDDPPAPGYYLRGRVFDALTLEPVANADLTLLAGTDSTHVASGTDGSYTIGPIPASASYRVSAKAPNMDSFEFTGLALPALEGDVTRALIGDVPMYASDKKTPAFNLVVDSADPRLPASAAVASVDFTPVRVGSDPSLPPANAPDISGSVVGAYAEPTGATLPNDAHSAAVGYHAGVEHGQAAVPQGALSWGATYDVRVDAGPDFQPIKFKLTPIHNSDIEIVLEPTGESPSGQLPQDTQQYFTGRIYDGVSMERLTKYMMRLEYFDRVISADIDDTGRYVVGPLLPNADYTVVVESDGYRSFLSHNAKIAAAAKPTLTSLYYDAFLYPTQVKAPAVIARVSLADSPNRPSGTIRFAPRSVSSLFNDVAETPAGVGRQVWDNDEDLQQRAVVRDFTNGQVQLDEGDLVLGVDYAVTIFGVANYALTDFGSFRAGVDTNPSFTMQPLVEEPLRVVSSSTDGGALSPSGSVEFRFNQDIKLYPRVAEATMVRALNDGLTITSPDKNMDGKQNVLADAAMLMAPVAADYRAVHMEITGDRLKLTWEIERGLSKVDTADPITSLRYGNLSSVWLYTGTVPSSPAATLEDLLGQASISVQMTAL
jgi:hypothetical protein